MSYHVIEHQCTIEFKCLKQLHLFGWWIRQWKGLFVVRGEGLGCLGLRRLDFDNFFSFGIWRGGNFGNLSKDTLGYFFTSRSRLLDVYCSDCGFIDDMGISNFSGDSGSSFFFGDVTGTNMYSDVVSTLCPVACDCSLYGNPCGGLISIDIVIGLPASELLKKN